MNVHETGRDALVHALLTEELTAKTTDVNSVDDILRRFADGQGATAAATLYAAEHDARQPWALRHWRLLCAAAALLALAATFVNSWWSDNSRSEVQDPQPRDPNAPIPVGDFDNLRKLAARVQRIEFEVLQLPDANLTETVQLQGAALELHFKMRNAILDDLKTTTTRIEPMQTMRFNQLRFHLDDGRHFRAAMYVFDDEDAGVRLHPEGMNGDLRIGPIGSNALRHSLGAATRKARMQHGIVTEPRDLRTFSVEHTSLRLFNIADEHLKNLARFTKLQRLDCSGLQKTLGKPGLRAITRACPQLRELRLDGVRFPDEHMLLITDMVKLTKIELRGVREFTGRGLRFYRMSAKRRDGPTHIDLRGVLTLTDDGLIDICKWDPTELLLGGSGANINQRGFAALAETKKLRTLGLRGWQLPDDWDATLRVLYSRKGLVIIR